MHQCSSSIRGGYNHFVLIILIIHIIISYDQNISLVFLCERWIPCQAVTSALCLHYRPETVHCSTKDAYTSEITFLALKPWSRWSLILCTLILRNLTSAIFYFFNKTILIFSGFRFEEKLRFEEEYEFALSYHKLISVKLRLYVQADFFLVFLVGWKFAILNRKTW